MKTRHLWIRLAGPALALMAAGCVMPFNGPAGARRDVQKLTGRDYHRTFALTVNRSALALARWAVDEDPETELLLKGLRKVEIGVYEARDRGGLPAGAILSAAPWPGWRPLVEIHGDGREQVLILYETREDESIRRLLFIVEDGDELVIVRLKGRLDTFIEGAIEYAFHEADRPDLIAPSLEEYRRESGGGAGP